jgi:hypothetical protein
MELPEGANMKPPRGLLYSFGGFCILAPDEIEQLTTMKQKGK